MQKHSIDSIIFDLDGTMWDSTPVVAVAWNHVLEQHRKQIILLPKKNFINYLDVPSLKSQGS